MEKIVLSRLFEVHIRFRWPPDTPPSSLVSRSKGVDRGFLTVHEEYLGAVALTGCARGDHTHLFASNFLVRSSTALRLLSGKYRYLVLSGYFEDTYDDGPLWPCFNP